MFYIVKNCNFIGEIDRGNCLSNGYTPALLSFLLVYYLNGEIMAKRIFELGERFNALTFIKELEPRQRKSKAKSGIGYERVMLWQCDCGNQKAILMSNVVTFQTKTCGCLQKAVCRQLLTVHGLYDHPLRVVRRNMIDRCYKKENNEVDYSRYGGRGITVCDQWRYSLVEFVKWAKANGYKKGLTIDRKDNNGNYEPSNCRFTDRLTQANNRRTNRVVYLDGQRYTLQQLCRKYNLNRKTATKYLNLGFEAKEVVLKMKNNRKVIKREI